MAPSEQFSQLSQQATARFEAAVEEVRQELLARLRAGLQATEEAVTSIAPLPPEDLLPAELEASLAPPAPPAASAELLAALRAVDAAGSQSELLAALVAGAMRFAARSALFLTAAQGVRGWVAGGFTGDLLAIDDLAVESEPGSPFGRLAAEPGVVPLDGDDCRALLGELGAEPAGEGFLVPIVLRDRLAAALYLDRREGDPEIDVTAAQVLAYCAAQALELQAGRDRPATSTLYATAAGAAVALWDETEEVAAAATAEAEAQSEPAAAPFLATAAVALAGAGELAEEAEPQPAWELDEALPADEPGAPELVLPADAEEELLAEDAAGVWEAEEDDTAISAAAPWPEPAPEPAEEEAPFAEPPAEMPHAAIEEPLAAPPETAAPAPGPPVEQAAAGEPELAAGPPAEAAPVGAETQRIPVFSPPLASAVDITEDETVMIPRQGPFPAPAPAPAPEPPAPAWAPAPRPAPAKGGEVAPPPDLQGPGWAFTASRQAAGSGDQALHEEARRLARLLIDEIKLYNEEQVEAGRRHRDLSSRLREDIERARQTYDGRVHERVRAGVDYFQQELVRILAGGDPGALGE